LFLLDVNGCVAVAYQVFAYFQLAVYEKCDYCGHMIATLRESKAHLSALVERAAQGEEVIITVHGKPKACLCPISVPDPKYDSWGRELREARSMYSTGVCDSSHDILDDLRGDR